MKKIKNISNHAPVIEREIQSGGRGIDTVGTLTLPAQHHFIRAITLTAVLIILLCFETTFLTRFPLFGATPDWAIHFVLALSVTGNPRLTAIFGIIAGVISGTLSGGLSFTPLLYCLIGYTAAALMTVRFRDTVALRILFIVSGSLITSLYSLIMLISTAGSVNVLSAIRAEFFPELMSNLILGFVPHLILWLILKLFTPKSRGLE